MTARRLPRAVGVLAVALASATAVRAQGAAGDPRVEALEARVRAQDARIRELEEAVLRLTGADRRPAAEASAAAVAIPPPAPAPAPPPPAPRPPATARLDLAGDLRLRHESNFGEAGARDRDRQVLRVRLRGAYLLSDALAVGAQLVIGDPDDPNSTDATLTGFNDDLPLSLDQAWLRYRSGPLELHAGKIPNPFVRTDLVWDADLFPAGFSAAYALRLEGQATLRASGLYFVVDEASAGPDSRMAGGQVALDTGAGAPWRLEAALGYYDYRLASVSGADAGDFRTNLLTPAGRYASDFDLLDAIAAVTYAGLGERWPLRLTAGYVRNFGAATAADTGFSVDLALGRASAAGDWRLGYGYAEVETDAVLAAFAQDNIPPGSNYALHSLSIDHALRTGLLLNATWYHYRPQAGDPVLGGRDWRDRVRLNLMVNF